MRQAAFCRQMAFLALMASMLCMPSMAIAQVYNATADFLPTNNPNAYLLGSQSNQLTFMTDSTWKATSVQPGGAWNSDPYYDDSGWNNAHHVYTLDFQINGYYLPGIWSTSDLMGIPLVAWMRKTFDLTEMPASALLDFFADDDCEVYVNGHLVFDDKNLYATNPATDLNVLPYLVPGRNVIAARVYDVQGGYRYGCARFSATTGASAGQTLYVATTGNDANPGTDPALPKQHIQAAVDAAASGDTIRVAVGDYDEHVTIGKSLTIIGAGDGTDPRAATIADGSFSGRVVTIAGAVTVTLQKMRVQNGKADSGGGIYSGTGGTLMLTDCTLSDNSAEAYGGGLYTDYGLATLTHCTVANNSAVTNQLQHGGGGIWNNYGMVTLIGCALTGNHANPDGGGIYNLNGTATLIDCALSGNVADGTNGHGGAILNGGAIEVGTLKLTNCTFSANSCSGSGGTIHSGDESSLTMTNCTVSGSRGWSTIVVGVAAMGTFTNCILWGDQSPEILLFGGNATVTYSDVEGGFPGTGNLSIDPLFVRNPFTNSPDDFGDLRLRPDSLCINAGSNTVVTVPPFLTDDNGVIIDLDDNPRIAGGTVDLGAYEAVASVLNVTAQVQITRGGLYYNRTTRRYVQTLTLRNSDGQAIQGPVSVVLDSLSPNAALYNKTGVTANVSPLGSPYKEVNVGRDGKLSTGESAAVTLEFTNPTNQAISYTARVLAGAGSL